jgi:hypothetical protein
MRPPDPETSHTPVDLEEPIIPDTGDDLMLPGSGDLVQLSDFNYDAQTAGPSNKRE